MTNEEQNKFPLPSLDNSGIKRRKELPSIMGNSEWDRNSPMTTATHCVTFH